MIREEIEKQFFDFRPSQPIHNELAIDFAIDIVRRHNEELAKKVMAIPHAEFTKTTVHLIIREAKP